MVDGEGDPNTSKSFADAIEALYPVSYMLKFMVKKGKMGMGNAAGSSWRSYDVRISRYGKQGCLEMDGYGYEPEFITQEMVKDAMAEVAKK